MIFSDLFESYKTINISVYTIILIAALVLGLLIFLVGVILYLLKKIKFLTKIRYGFGGKPLFSFLVVLGVTIAIPLTMYASLRSVNVIKMARAEKDVIIEVSSFEKEEDLYNVSFMAIPTLDGKSWADKVYTVTWYIEGEIILEKIEKDRDSKHPSYFITQLPSGEYKVKVSVESENFHVVEIEHITLE